MGIEREVRVIVDTEPREGAENLAIDWMLLSVAAGESQDTLNTESAAITEYRKKASAKVPILRFYRWRPTLSLGHFQTQHSIPQSFANTKGIEIVWRPSGGGAIVHDQEWTYALVLPPEIYAELLTAQNTRNRANSEIDERRSPVTLVRGIHRATVTMLRNEYGLDARLAEDVPAKFDHSTAEFLCFQRRAAEDVVVIPHAAQEVTAISKENWAGHGAKVLGSAMRMRRGAVLIHGSFLMRRSKFAPELPGVLDFLPKSVENQWESQRKLAQQWKTAIVTALWKVPDGVSRSQSSEDEV